MWQTHLEELAAHKGEAEGISAVKELNKLIHIEKVRNTARRHGWSLKEKRKCMVDHIPTPTFVVTEISALMFFILVPAWLLDMGLPQGNKKHTDLILGPSYGMLDNSN